MSERRRSPTRQQAILDAAAALVEELGYENCTIEGVARRAGAGKQTIYRWWASKPALFVELYQLLVAREAVAARYADPRRELEVTLAAVFRHLTDTVAGAVLRGLIADATHDEVARAAINSELVFGRRDILLGPLRRAAAAGTRDWAPEEMLEMLVAVIWKTLILEPDALNDALAARLAALVLGPVDDS